MKNPHQEEMRQLGGTIDGNPHKADASTDRSSNARSTPFSKPPVRVGLLLDDLVQPAWAARAISELFESPAIDVALIILNDTPPSSPRGFHRVRHWIRNRHSFGFELYQAFDRRRFAAENNPFIEVDLTTLLEGVPVRRVRARMREQHDYFEPEDVEAIRAFDLDVAARFGFRDLKGEALTIAHHGVWSYHHGDNSMNRGTPAGFWEVMEDAPVTGCLLQRLTEHPDEGAPLYRAFLATNPFSLQKNRAGLFWTSAPILRRVLEDLYRLGPEAVFQRERAIPARDSYHQHPQNRAPSNRDVVRLVARLVRRHFRERVRTLGSFDQWFLAYRLRPEAAPEAANDRFRPDANYDRFDKLIPGPDRFWADPFAVEFEGRHYIFFEDYFFSTDRGRISLFEIGADGSAQGPVPVLERDYHLSYPFVFDWRGEHYMIPETHANGQVELFRATRFPYEWCFDRVLIPDVRATDATIAEIGGQWWMFASVSPHVETEWDDLWLFYADSPFGPWKPHRRNPVKSDVRSARPAGRIFTANGKHFRPAQDSSVRYGHSIVVNEIVRLDVDEFMEVEVSRIPPDWTDGLLATHTINADGRLTVIDGQISRRGRPR